jgi:hypothetical protein
MGDIVSKSSGAECKGTGKGGMPRLEINRGTEYNWLTVLRECTPTERPESTTDVCYNCRCRCGTEVIATASSLKSGHHKSCGCITTRLKYSIENGDKFGKLVVIGRRCTSSRKGTRRRTQYKCKCVCGNETWVHGRNLFLGNTKSCGCGLVFNKKYKGFVGNVPVVVFNHWKTCAKRRGIVFAVTIDDLDTLFRKQNGHCALTGFKIGFGPKTNSAHSRTASLDRIDSRKGYELGNVWWVHKDINIMKLNHSMKYFISLCRKVTGYNK